MRLIGKISRALIKFGMYDTLQTLAYVGPEETFTHTEVPSQILCLQAVLEILGLRLKDKFCPQGVALVTDILATDGRKPDFSPANMLEQLGQK
jgi:hypothetical protein